MKHLIIASFLLALSTAASAIIIRGDSRIQEGDTKGLRVGQLKSSKPGNKIMTCSATMISKKYLLTAAHCVTYLGNGQPVRQLEFFPLVNDIKKRLPHSRIFIKRGWINKKYLRINKELAFMGNIPEKNFPEVMIPHDVAILEAYSDYTHKYLGQEIGWRGVFFDELKPKETADIILRSYPGDKPRGTLWKERCYLKNPKNKPPYFISCDLYPGSSGGGIDQFLPEYNKAYITGVVSATSSTRNLIAPLNRKTYQNIRQLIVSDKIAPTSKVPALFQPIRFDTQKKMYFSVANSCHEPVEVKIMLHRSSGAGGRAFYRIKKLNPGQRISLGEGVGPYWFFTARSLVSKIAWHGKEGIKEDPTNKTYIRKSTQDENGRDRFGDMRIDLSCS